MQVISIDYDDTWTTCPIAWRDVANRLAAAGFKVICVTARDEAKHPISDFPGEVFYTSGQPKGCFMEAAGLSVDIWIDDMPHLICGVPRSA